MLWELNHEFLADEREREGAWKGHGLKCVDGSTVLSCSYFFFLSYPSTSSAGARYHTEKRLKRFSAFVIDSCTSQVIEKREREKKKRCNSIVMCCLTASLLIGSWVANFASESIKLFHYFCQVLLKNLTCTYPHGLRITSSCWPGLGRIKIISRSDWWRGVKLAR